MLIRHAAESDAAQIAGLLPDLGYVGDASDVQRRMKRLTNYPDNALFVAVIDNSLVGLCHAQGTPLLATDGYSEIQALVVSNQFQRRGIGRELVAAAVNWSVGLGYTRVRLRSGLHRTEAHLFYEGIGFKRSKPSYAFERVIQKHAA